jgi:biopolymer transport protein TolR
VLQLVENPDGPPFLKINEDHVGWNDLESRLRAIFDLRKEKVIFVKADRKVEWNEVAQAIDVAHTAGIQNVGLLTKELQ